MSNIKPMPADLNAYLVRQPKREDFISNEATLKELISRLPWPPYNSSVEGPFTCRSCGRGSQFVNTVKHFDNCAVAAFEQRKKS